MPPWDRESDYFYYSFESHIPVAKPSLGGNEVKYVSECLVTNWISSQGNYVNRFEKIFAEYCDVNHAITSSSGTTALHLALTALGIGQGDEVIVPDLTFAACANVIIHCGARPVFIDVTESTWTMDPVLLEDLITERTKAIMPVHLYGHPCDMDAIIDIARKHKIYVIEDCAEALGSLYKSKRVGTQGTIGCFSFFANKLITTGEGGMLITNDKRLKEVITKWRDHGMSREKKYWHELAGFNYRMTNIQAAIGVAQMEKIDNFIEIRDVTAKKYRTNLSGIQGITLPPEEEWAKNIFWLFSILVDEKTLGLSPEDFMKRLEGEGIETRPFFSPLHKQPPYPKPSFLRFGYYP